MRLPAFVRLLLLAMLPLAVTAASPSMPSTPSEAERLARAIANLQAASVHKQQRALATLGALTDQKSEQTLLAQFDRWETGQLPLSLWLDLAEAADHRPTPALGAKLASYRQTLSTGIDPMRRWRECLEGGDADEGREIFRHKVEAGCVRCHKVDGEGGEIGPDLTGLGTRMDRLYILESIVDPNAIISPGFDQVLLTLSSGEEIAGIVHIETPDYLIVVSPADSKKRQIRTGEIVNRLGLPSAMPPLFGQVLTKRDIRDLVEFIATSQ